MAVPSKGYWFAGNSAANLNVSMATTVSSIGEISLKLVSRGVFNKPTHK